MAAPVAGSFPAADARRSRLSWASVQLGPPDTDRQELKKTAILPPTLPLSGGPMSASPLFNRLVGKAGALVDDQLASPRNRRREAGGASGRQKFHVGHRRFTGRPAVLPGHAHADATAVAQADAAMFLIDARAGVTRWTRISPVGCAGATCRSCWSQQRRRESRRRRHHGSVRPWSGRSGALSAESMGELADLFQALLPHI